MQKQNIEIMNNFEQRIQEYRQTIDKRSLGYRRRLKQQYEIDILKRLPEKFEVVIPAKDQDFWMERFEKVVANLPSPSQNGTSYVKQKNELLRELNKKYNLQRKGQWVAIYAPVFMVSIGVSIGTATGNLVLWLPLGIAIGVMTGYFMEKRAKRKNLVL
ncbi:hypothetical protein [Belliella aquatica]|uniref:Uncharacterized protein n=1 Tax=Belliella aquatica TaxID=1323734 RepID=A0ABQ1LZR6_9BACT|nr:hypothetical protein [Belliella aquatica]MCH7405755.1 hypothetical protein [Belliella aquatica]GGC31013.1 hypothetical protein GCM10010993_07380 [Belliella aquatica]